MKSIIFRTTEFPKVIEEDLIRPTLNAYFHIGRLYGKFIFPDKMLQHQNIKKSVEAYQVMIISVLFIISPTQSEKNLKLVKFLSVFL